MAKDKRRVTLFIATSLDGYIATLDNDLNWLFEVEGEGDNGYGEMIREMDTLIMGKATYDFVMDQEKGNYPYTKEASYIWTREANHPDTSWPIPPQATFFSQNPVDLVNKLKEEEGEGIWIVGGGQLIRPLLEADCIDCFRVTVSPILLGKGIPLFLPFDGTIKLKLKKTTTYGQFVELWYER